MNYKRLAVVLSVLGLAMVLGFTMFSGSKTRAAAFTCSVPSGSYPTIQSAVNDPGCSTINVDPGTYAENVLIARQLTLSGAGDTTIIQPPVPGPGISLTAGGSTTASRTVIENLKVTGASGGGNTGSGISILGGAGPIGFITFAHVTSTTNSGHGIAINNTATMNDIVISDSSLSNNLGVGFRIPTSMLSMDGLLITDSHLDNNGFAGWEASTNLSAGPLQNVTVSDTTFNNNLNKGMYFERLSNAQFTGIEVDNSGTSGGFSAGIDINLKYANFQNIVIQDSIISDSGTGDPINGVGLTIKARNDSPSYSARPATLVGVIVSGNEIKSNQTGIRFGEPLKNNSGPTGVAVHENNITGNLNLGIDNQTVPQVNAECNWWGSADGPGPVGPGSGDKVTPNVDYTPWQTSPGGPCVGPDADSDGVTDSADNCPSTPNPGQDDADNDDIGDACDACIDVDGDEVCGNADNCPTVANPGQENADGDAQGDVCDPDDDNDGVNDAQDECANTPLGTPVSVKGCPKAVTANQCKNDGWKTLQRLDGTGFKNQGDCIQYTNTGK